MAIDPALAALLSFGGGLASAAAPSRVPQGMGSAMGQAGMGGLAGYMQAQQLAQQERNADLEALQMAMKARQSRQQREAVQKYAQHLPEEQRALATAFPQIAAQQHAKSMFAEPKAPKAPRIETFIQGGQEIQKQWNPDTGEWVEVGRGARWKPQGQEEPGFGASLVGRAHDTLREYDAYVRNEQKPPPEMETRARQAAHILQRPQIITMPDGSRAQYTPGIPEGLAYPGQPQETAGEGAVRRGTGATITEFAESPTTERTGQALETVENITSLLGEATEAGETITGIEGTAKALGGGLARQFGMPVSERSKRLQRQLEALKAQVTPMVLGESGAKLSDKDRQRLDQIVGTLSWSMDEVELRSSLNDLLNIIGRAEGGEQQPSESQTGDIGQMTLDDLTKLDPTTMSPDELRAAAQRYDDLAAEQ